MRIAKRLQVNMYLRPVSGIASMADIDTIVFPLAWLNEVRRVIGRPCVSVAIPSIIDQLTVSVI